MGIEESSQPGSTLTLELLTFLHVLLSSLCHKKLAVFAVSAFTLSVVDQTIVVTEGNTTETFVSLRRNFESDLPITISIQGGSG